MDIPPELRDFRNFAFIAWKHLVLPDPTPLQYDICGYLQNGPKRSVIQAFRGVGKSWLCSAYVVHQLYLNPSLNILVVSASKTRSDDFSTFTLRLINELPILSVLKPRDGQRFSKISFDVGPAPASHAPSVKSLGITSQLTGSRADIIVADDIEVANNSATQGMRDKLSDQVKEFDAIVKPLDDSRIIFLGTPQCEDSIYTKLRERGYETRVWPSEYVSSDTNTNVYEDAISPFLDASATESNIGHTTEPLRFSDIDLEERKLSYGRSGYALQFMLNPRLSDADRYPLKVNDLIVTDLDNEVACEKYVWASGPEQVIPDIPNVGFSGDRFHRPFQTLGDMVEYTGSVMAIDPSGRGRDETGYAIVKMLNGFLFVHSCGGIRGGYGENVLKQLALLAARYKVNEVIVESNFGDGMFSELFKPVINAVHPVTMTEVRHNIQKEKRIIDTMEPVMNAHKLIVDLSVVKDDYTSCLAYPIEQQTKYTLIHQLSRITAEKGALLQDDRLDALAIAIGYWVEQMAANADLKMNDRKNELLDKELNKFIDTALGQKGRNSNLWF
jgi:Holliday junction resolvasome RuvABC endonuclease subunit